MTVCAGESQDFTRDTMVESGAEVNTKTGSRRCCNTVAPGALTPIDKTERG